VVNRDAGDGSDTQRPASGPFRRRFLLGGLVGASVLVIGIGVAPAGAMDGLPGPWHRGAEHGAAVDHDRHDEREDASCVMPDTPAPTTTVPGPVDGAVTQTVTVVVPPTVRVQSTGPGTLSVVTNASRAPAPGDEVYRLQPDGSYVRADEALVSQVMSAHWADGSWCSTTAEHRGTMANAGTGDGPGHGSDDGRGGSGDEPGREG
jgi:hypothetical protein